MTRCLFASDLHGHADRYDKLFQSIRDRRPAIVLLGGDLLPNPWVLRPSIDPSHVDFLNGFIGEGLTRLKEDLEADYPEILVILGNDDGRIEESSVLALAASKLWTYAHDRCLRIHGHTFVGYSYIPPSPFQLKDWERYDVSRYVDPGCVSPEEGIRSVPVSKRESRYSTIARDLAELTEGCEFEKVVCLFHSPPYQTELDRADLDGKSVDFVPLDVNIGSIAVRKFIEKQQPLLGLHGHVHESARLTGNWRDRLGRTELFSAAHDGPELALVEFDLENPSKATRSLL